MSTKNKIFTREEGYSEEVFLSTAAGHYTAALELFGSKKPFTWFSAGYLSHLAIELLLKAWCINLHNSCKQTHKLFELVREISELKLNQDDKNIIEQLDMLYELRYPINNIMKAKNIQVPVDGNRFYGEVGTMDLEMLVAVANTILLQMPNTLSPLFLREIERASFTL